MGGGAGNILELANRKERVSDIGSGDIENWIVGQIGASKKVDP